MTKNKPKGKTPSLIGGSLGKPTKAIASRKSECKRCNETIAGGDSCFEIPKLGGQFVSTKRFCHSCFSKILEETQKDIDKLKQYLGNEKCCILE